MLRDDALAIWQAGVKAVDSKTLVSSNVRVRPDLLEICDEEVPLQSIDHVEIVGGGKAGAGMVEGLLETLSALPDGITVSGWVNVPADCVRDCSPVVLHPARPAGVNEPRVEGVEGTQEIIRRVSRLTERSLCIVLISGGGSALLPAPAPGISLEDKLAVTRSLSAAGATIQQLNTVRSQISEIKGGGLVRKCSAGRMVALVISDVVGDPLDKIASGPTVASCATAHDALDVLSEFDPEEALPGSIYQHLRGVDGGSEGDSSCSNYVIGSNSIAVSAAQAEAERRGYRVVSVGSEITGEAEMHGRELIRQLQQIRSSEERQPVCLLAGGETTVQLAPTSQARKGGRNQEVVLAAVADQPKAEAWKNIALISGGTDGEDGPTDAAGAVADESFVNRMVAENVHPNEFLRINNSYPFFDRLEGLVRTGPTHTNVMDLAVGVVRVDS